MNWTPATARLTEAMARVARGPRREGVYAVWLVVRAAEDRSREPPIPPKLLTRQLESLTRRLATLTPPAAIRRGVASALALLAEGGPDAPAAALHQLTAPARDALGPEVADALHAAARAARAPKQ
ncbi:MAG TPA: hypothetical protein VFI13_10715 [Gemmatimonadales bacterium]|nr:hypothetical protein [Gemmatimonadales bacterium]